MAVRGSFTVRTVSESVQALTRHVKRHPRDLSAKTDLAVRQRQLTESLDSEKGKTNAERQSTE